MPGRAAGKSLPTVDATWLAPASRCSPRKRAGIMPSSPASWHMPTRRLLARRLRNRLTERHETAQQLRPVPAPEAAQ